MKRLEQRTTKATAIVRALIGRGFVSCRNLSVGLLLVVTPLSLPLRIPPSDDLTEKFQRAAASMRQRNLDQAGDDFATITKQAPTFAEAFLNLGLVREEQRRHEEAIAAFQRALQLKPRLRGANLFLGISEYRMNRLDAAMSALHKETTISPKDSNAWMWLGIVALEKENEEEAVQALDQAARLPPDSVNILYHRGRARLNVFPGELCAHVQS